MRMTKFLRSLLFLIGIAAVAGSIAMKILSIGTPGFGAFKWTLLGGGALLSLTASLPKAWLDRILLVFISIGLTCLFAEVLLRITYSYHLSSLYQVDELRLYRLIPGSRKIFERAKEDGGDSILTVVNSRGFIGGELRPRAKAKRVVVYGDSFIAGSFSRPENRFVSKLEESLTTQLGTQVEAINAGVPGYGPDQSYLQMEEQIDSLKPDAVILALYADNDFGDLLRNKLFSLDADGRLTRNSPFPSRELRWNIQYAAHAPLILRLVSKGLPAIFERLRPPISTTTPPAKRIDEWLKTCRSEFDTYIPNRNLEVVNLLEDHYDADISVDPESESSRFKIRLMERILGRTSEFLRAKQIPLVLLIIPSAIDLVEDYPLAPVDVSRFPLYDRTRLTRILEVQAQKLGVPHLNLFAPFSSYGAKKLYFLKDDHWNDPGQAYAARLLADLLSRERIL
jgi:lysophospholipase L1-like esterase